MRKCVTVAFDACLAIKGSFWATQLALRKVLLTRVLNGSHRRLAMRTYVAHLHTLQGGARRLYDV